VPACLLIISAPPSVLAQTFDSAPFFNSAAVGYEATISTAFSGAALSAHTTVSADRKYVTVGAQASIMGQPNFTPFTIAVPVGGGFVGSPAAGAPPATTMGASILDRPGMTLLAPLRP
jgi:hypothetical protein